MTTEIHIHFENAPAPVYAPRPGYPAPRPYNPVGPARPVYNRPQPMNRPQANVNAPYPYPRPVPITPQRHPIPRSELIERVNQFIELATRMNCAVMYSDFSNSFLAIGQDVIIQTHGSLPQKLMVHIYNSLNVVEANFGTETMGDNGDMSVRWVSAAQIERLTNMLNDKLERQLNRFTCPECNRALEDHMPLKCCPFCGYDFARGDPSEELRACVNCRGAKDSDIGDEIDYEIEVDGFFATKREVPAPEYNITFIYHPACRFCPRCGQKLKIWSERHLWQFDYIPQRLFFSGVTMERLEIEKFSTKEFIADVNRKARKPAKARRKKGTDAGSQPEVRNAKQGGNLTTS